MYLFLIKNKNNLHMPLSFVYLHTQLIFTFVADKPGKFHIFGFFI